jgi:hypothetical protein
LLELARDLRDLGVTSCDLAGVKLEFGPIPVKPMALTPEDVVELARASAEAAREESEKIAMWSAS